MRIKVYFKEIWWSYDLPTNNELNEKEVEKQKNNTETKDLTNSLTKEQKNFLCLDSNDVKLIKNKKWEKVYIFSFTPIMKWKRQEDKKYEIWRLKEREIKNLLKNFDSYKNIIHFLNNTWFNLLDIFNSLPDDKKNIEGIKDNLNFLSNTISIFKKVDKDWDILKDIEFTSFFTTALYWYNYENLDENKIWKLVSIYKEKILKWKTEKEKKNILITNFIGDLTDWWENLPLYESKNFDNLQSIVIEGNEWTSELTWDKLFDLWLLNHNLYVSDIDADKLDLSHPISFKIFNLYNYLKWYYIDYNKLLAKWQKVSIDELIVLNLFLSKKENILKNALGNKYEIMLQNIAKKFWKNNINEVKSMIYDDFLSTIILWPTDKKILDNFKKMFYKLPLYKAKRLLFSIGSFFSYLNLKDKKNYIFTYNILKQEVLENAMYMNLGDRKELLIWINKILDEKKVIWLDWIKKIDEKDVEKKHKQEINDLLLISRWIDKINIENVIKWFKSDWFEIRNFHEVKSILKDMFSKDNIEQFKKEFSNGNFSTPLEFFVSKLEEKNLFNYIIKKWKNPIDNSSKHNITFKLMQFVLKQIKWETILKTKELIEWNKIINNIIDTSANKYFKIDNPQEKLKKDLALANLKYEIGSALVKKNQDTITKDFLNKNKKNILEKIQKQFGVWVKKLWKLSTYYLNIVKVYDDLIKNLPEAGVKLDKKLINELKENKEIIKNVEKDFQKYKELWYEWYMAYIEEIETRKKLLLNDSNGSMKTYVPISESPFRNKGDSWKVETIYEEIWWIHTIYMKIPWKDNIVRVDALHLADANNELISSYFEEICGLNINLKGSVDDLNKFVSEQTDISKDAICSQDFDEINLKAQNIIYHNFYVNGWQKEKDFLKKNNIQDPYLLYTKPREFWERFSKWLKKETSIWGIKPDINGYTIDLAMLDKNLLDIEKAKKTKEKILDTWQNKNIFSRTINTLKKLFS